MQTEYQILYDTGAPLCFVGNTQYNHMLFNDLKSERPCLLHTLEEVLAKPIDWIQQHQFFSACSTISFKKFVKESLENLDIHWVSIIGIPNAIHNGVEIGHNVYVNYYNSLLPGIHIGSHSTITTHCVIAHGAIINDYCHISPYTSLHCVTLGEGCCIGMRSTILGQTLHPINIADYTNISFNSFIRKSILESGTYQNTKKINSQNSHDYMILK